MIDHLADADGHIIEPGDLWAERLPNDLRPLAPRFYRDPEGVFHSRIYGIEIDTLPVMHGGMKPKDMLDNMGLSCAMGMPLERVFTGAEREKHTILDAPRWAMDGRERLAFNTEHGVSRAILYPTFMLAGGTLLPHLAPAVCAVYNDWILDDYCAGFPLDMMHTRCDMRAGGVFDRFPTMPTMILEAGVGWLPSMLERFEEHREAFGRIKTPEWKTPPMEIFERQMMVTVEACEAIDLKIALEFLPADHIALASAWPHPDGTPDLLAGFRKASAGLGEDDVRMVATGTLERWFP